MNHFITLKELSLAASDNITHHGSFKSKQNQSAFVVRYTSLHNWLAIIDNDYILDSFNYFGIKSAVSNSQIAYQILNGDCSEFQDDLPEEISQSCENVYALLHARYILTGPGLQAMRRKYESGIFGQCPRFLCQGQNLLPVGESPNLGIAPVRTFCPKCQDIFESDCEIDGAHFGPSFPHFFLQMNQDLNVILAEDHFEHNFFGIPIEKDSDLLKNRIKRGDETST
ncbi:Casein kinase II subunit beta [Tritrichomonas foetus]|uniref:Casein kinase II subunit beta n=1 Tax=Tritrichomonas foetus TaxID=1144522 RepID=A0A1J4JZS2_9EUKA|nr:Casein kinase II subunit beta [Tritrichomonas foetus]|eukprot:OHT04186.1 Casein kinase II subunit beta [Tritrichomonas foetus]